MNIREEVLGPHMTKWHLEGPWPFQMAVHRFTHPDGGPPHDHPFDFRSTILSGCYIEEVHDPETGAVTRIQRDKGQTHFVGADHIHRIVELPLGETWSLIVPDWVPPRHWYFYKWQDGVKLRSRHWDREFTRVGAGGRVEVREAAE